MAFPPRFLEELRGRVSITDIVGRRVRLIRKGRGEATGLCPFHNEKTPSFTVSEDKGFFHCFGCGVHGDVIGFVMRSEGLEFPQAVEKLAGEAGMQVPRETPEERERAERQATLGGAVEFAAKFYEQQLRASAGRAGLEYLKRRGLTDDTMRRFRLGHAPDTGARAEGSAGKGRHSRSDLDRGRPADQAGGWPPVLRPVPRPGDVPDPRPQGPGDRVRRAHPGPGRAEIPELAGDAALPQGPGALWPQPRAEDRARDQRDHRGRRLYGRDRAGAGGDQQRGRAARHRADRGSAGAALAHGAGADPLLRRRQCRPARRRAGGRPGAFRC